jgi:hypothetical protein
VFPQVAKYTRPPVREQPAITRPTHQEGVRCKDATMQTKQASKPSKPSKPTLVFRACLCCCRSTLPLTGKRTFIEVGVPAVLVTLARVSHLSLARWSTWCRLLRWGSVMLVYVCVFCALAIFNCALHAACALVSSGCYLALPQCCSVENFSRGAIVSSWQPLKSYSM